MEVDIASFATPYIALRLAMFSVFTFAIFRALSPAGIARTGNKKPFFSINGSVEVRAR